MRDGQIEKPDFTKDSIAVQGVLVDEGGLV